MTELIVIDDRSSDIKALLNSIPCLKPYSKKYFDCSTIHPISEYNQQIFTSTFDVTRIRTATKLGLEALLDGDGPWLVLLDYENCRCAAAQEDYYNINDAVHRGVLDAIGSLNNAYLILYTASAPHLVSDLYDRLIEIIKDPANGITMHLFHRMLNISFFNQPVNYQHIVHQDIMKELKLIERGAAEDVHWSNASECIDD